MANYKSPITGAPLPVGKPFKRGKEQQELAKKAGKASGAARRAKRTLREQLEMLLAEQRTDKSGKKMTVQAGMTAALVKAAFEGNTRAYEIVRDTIGQKPSEKIEVISPDFTELDSVMRELKRK